MQGDPSPDERVAELAEKANEGELSAAEREEYEAYIEANNLLAIVAVTRDEAIKVLRPARKQVRREASAAQVRSKRKRTRAWHDGEERHILDYDPPRSCPT